VQTGAIVTMTTRSDEPLPGRDGEVVRLLEEQATVGVREVTTGRIRVTTRVEAFEQVARADLLTDTLDVVRVPVGRPVDGTLPQVRTEGEVTIVPVFEEVLVVEKRLMLKEELHIRRKTEVETVSAPVTLRRQTAEVERLEGEQ